MADVKSKKPEETVEKQLKPVENPARQESVYGAEQIIRNHESFGVSREIAAAALKLSGKTVFTFSEAAKMIETLKNRRIS